MNDSISRKERGEGRTDGPLRFFLYRFLVTLGVSGILLLLAGAADYMTDDPGGNARRFALLALYLSSVIGGVLVSSSSLPFYLSGLIPGSAYLLLLTAISFGLPEQFSSGASVPVSLLLHLAVIGCFLLGSLLGNVRKHQSKNKRPRRHRRA